MKTFNWGIVGAGRISSKFCNDLTHVSDAVIYAVAARSIENTSDFSKQHDIKCTYEGYQALFDDPNVDIVYLGVPHTLHYETARNAILAKKHVLCEKPLVVSPQECLALCQLAKDNNVFLMEAMWTYFLPAIQKAKIWIHSGRIGKIRHIKIDFGYKMNYSPTSREYNAELAGGCLFDMGIYPLALTQYFLENELSNIQVYSHVAPNGVDDDLIIIGDCGDVKASLSTSFRCVLPNNAFIIGENGYIAIPHASRAKTCSLYQGDDCIDSFVDDRESYGYNYEVEEVHRQISAGNLESPLMTHDVSLKLQKQMFEIKQKI